MGKVTYGQLDEVLRSLGFTAWTNEQSTPKARVYKHELTGALIVLPVMPRNKVAIGAHLVGVRSTLDDFGIATPKEFEEILQKATCPPES